MAFTNTPASDFVFRDHTGLLKANGSAQEQTFIENLIVESIEIYGQDIYYMPRTYVNRDTILGEVENSRFAQALQVRAYVNNVEGWEGALVGDNFSFETAAKDNNDGGRWYISILKFSNCGCFNFCRKKTIY